MDTVTLLVQQFAHLFILKPFLLLTAHGSESVTLKKRNTKSEKQKWRPQNCEREYGIHINGENVTPYWMRGSCHS
jgi:hypothetical protein